MHIREYTKVHIKHKYVGVCTPKRDTKSGQRAYNYYHR